MPLRHGHRNSSICPFCYDLPQCIYKQLIYLSCLRREDDRDSSDFQYGATVDVHQTNHSISDAEMKFVFSQTIILRVYRVYKNSGKSLNMRHYSGHNTKFCELNHRRLSRIVSRIRCATLLQVILKFNAGNSTSISTRTVQHTLQDMALIVDRQLQSL